MCDPVTAIVLAGSAYTLNEQRKAAKRSERFYREAQAEQEEQIHASKSIEANDRAQRARAERARLRAAAAESGLSGITTDDILRDVDFQAGRDISRIQLSQEFEQTASRYSLQSNLNNIRQPDYIGSALNAGLVLAERSERTDT